MWFKFKGSSFEKTSNKWTETKGYDLTAQMEIKSGAEPRTYDVNVWHTKPDFYRVAVAQQGEKDSQMIIRNEDGVFVVTPSMKKRINSKVIGRNKIVRRT